MKTEHEKAIQQAPRLLRISVEKMLPRALRKDYMAYLDETYQSVWQFVPESVSAVVSSYRIQAVAAFNKRAHLAEIAAGGFCFAAAGVSLPLFIVLGAILSALTLRDAYTHRGQVSAIDAPAAPGKKRPSAAAQYYVDSSGDAATAALFLLTSQTLMLKISSSLAAQPTVLSRGAFIFFPLLATLRMVLRPRPDAPSPFDGSNMSAERIYKITRHLNAIWWTVCIAIILTNPDAVATSGWLAVLIPVVTLVTPAMWLRLQQDTFKRDDTIETIGGYWKKKESGRNQEQLPKGPEKNDPLYRAYAALEVLFFLMLAMPLAVHLWPWLSGQNADLDYFRIGFNLGALGTLVLSWNYMKNANRAAARALQQEIDAQV